MRSCVGGSLADSLAGAAERQSALVLAVCVLLGCSSAGGDHAQPKRESGLLPKAVAQESALSAVAPNTAVVAALPQTGAHGVETPDPTTELLGMLGSLTTSLGAPAGGHLQGGVRLPDRGPGYYHNPKRPTEARYGTVETLQTIVRAAAIVDRDMPGSSLTINDVGLREGGPISQHGSHQAGRDADILFYVLDMKGKPIPAVGVPFDPKGQGIDFKDLAIPGDDQKVKIDLPRTWRFVQALLEEAPDQLQRIFIVEHLRNMLVTEAERARAPKAIRQRFDELTCQPSTPHDDHMHVRFFCSPEDMALGCEDSAPLYPWRVAALSAFGLDPIIASSKRTPEERADRAARTTSAAEAKKKAGPMHKNVIKFLKEREAWLKQPHPGRPYCK
jgi:penicillin-insensitive murein endopeptidase